MCRGQETLLGNSWTRAFHNCHRGSRHGSYDSGCLTLAPRVDSPSRPESQRIPAILRACHFGKHPYVGKAHLAMDVISPRVGILLGCLAKIASCWQPIGNNALISSPKLRHPSG